MKYVYIAGPYTKDDPVINTANVIRAADELASHGYYPYVPHLTLFWHLIYPHDIRFWYDLDIAWLKKCDCLLRLPGESSGADNEVRIAKNLGMPIYYSIEELIENKRTE
jgi:hypothetical protein